MTVTGEELAKTIEARAPRRGLYVSEGLVVKWDRDSKEPPKLTLNGKPVAPAQKIPPHHEQLRSPTAIRASRRSRTARPARSISTPSRRISPRRRSFARPRPRGSRPTATREHGQRSSRDHAWRDRPEDDAADVGLCRVGGRAARPRARTPGVALEEPRPCGSGPPRGCARSRPPRALPSLHRVERMRFDAGHGFDLHPRVPLAEGKPSALSVALYGTTAENHRSWVARPRPGSADRGPAAEGEDAERLGGASCRSASFPGRSAVGHHRQRERPRPAARSSTRAGDSCRLGVGGLRCRGRRAPCRREALEAAARIEQLQVGSSAPRFMSRQKPDRYEAETEGATDICSRGEIRSREGSARVLSTDQGRRAIRLMGGPVGCGRWCCPVRRAQVLPAARRPGDDEIGGPRTSSDEAGAAGRFPVGERRDEISTCTSTPSPTRKRRRERRWRCPVAEVHEDEGVALARWASSSSGA